MAKNIAGKPPPLCILNHPFRPFRKLQESVHFVRQSHMPFFMQIQVVFLNEVSQEFDLHCESPFIFLNKSNIKKYFNIETRFA